MLINEKINVSYKFCTNSFNIFFINILNFLKPVSTSIKSSVINNHFSSMYVCTLSSCNFPCIFPLTAHFLEQLIIEKSYSIESFHRACQPLYEWWPITKRHVTRVIYLNLCAFAHLSIYQFVRLSFFLPFQGSERCSGYFPPPALISVSASSSSVSSP